MKQNIFHRQKGKSNFVIKNCKTIVAMVIVSLTFFSCSKNDDTISDLVSYENNTPVAILSILMPNNQERPSISEIKVDKAGFIKDKNKIILEMNIKHTYSAQLTFSLIAPDGLEQIFIAKAGNKPFIAANKVRFSSQFSKTINFAEDIVAGDYKESKGESIALNIEPIFSFLQNKNIQGTWKLKVVDSNSDFGAEIISWKLIFERGAFK